jgi:serine O-acetyltransferase
VDPKHLGETLPQLVDRLVESYFSDPRTHHVDKSYLPSKAGIVRVCDLLLELNYPGYIGRQGLTRHNISYHVGELLPRLWEQLCKEILQCLCHESEESSAPPADETPYRKRAMELADEFLKRMPNVRAQLAEDVQAHYDGDPAAVSTAEVILAYPGLLAITIYRYAHQLYLLDVPKVPRIMTEHAHQLTGVDIHPGARIGRSFCIDHATGVVIGETTEIGDSVKLYQGVTLGALSFAKDERGRIIRGHKRHPTIGNNVTIYSNATLLGGETVIGDGAIIGGGVFLTRSVAPGHQVTLAAPVLKVRPPRPPGAPKEPRPDEFSANYAI